MAYSINEIELLGNVGGVDVRQNGEMKVTRIRLATSDGGYKTREGKEIPLRTEWHSIVCFNREAALAEAHVKKGDRLLIKGKLTYGEYTDKNGQKRFTSEILCREIYLLNRTEQRTEPVQEASTQLTPTPAGNDDFPF